MKKFQKISLLFSLAFSLFGQSCKKSLLDDLTTITTEVTTVQVFQTQPRYSSVADFKKGISQVAGLIASYNIPAYLDTLENGYPNTDGRRAQLAEFAYSILEKLNGDETQVESGIYDVFHFDGNTFSLISYLMKAQMAGDITYQNLTYLISLIPLPPLPVDNFDPPIDLVVADSTEVNCCDNCNPNVNIRVTWAYKPPCGNYEKKTSGYAANNTLTHMSGGKMYRFDAEVTGCNCPGGVWSYTVDAPDGASYGASSGSPSTVTLFPQTSGTYKITFTYKVCNKTATKTFTLGVGG